MVRGETERMKEKEEMGDGRRQHRGKGKKDRACLPGPATCPSQRKGNVLLVPNNLIMYLLFYVLGKYK